MRPILFLLPSFDAHAHARQASLLLPALPRDRLTLRAYCLHGNGQLAAPIIAAGIPRQVRSENRALGLENWLSVKQTLAVFRPALIHVWGIECLKAIWWATLLNRSLLPPVVVSLRASVLKKHRLGWWNRRLMKRVRAIIVPSDAELIRARGGWPAGRENTCRPSGCPAA